jgi:uncharacterized protein YggE
MRILNEIVMATVLVAGGLGIARQAEEDDRTPSLTVTGEAEASAAPDRAVVGLGATFQATSAAAAQRHVNEAMQRVSVALRELGVADADVQTAMIALAPVYSDSGPRTPGEPVEPQIVGYRASNSVRIRLDDTAAIGAVIDAGIAAGVNELQGISFELSDDTAQRVEALRAAVRNAQIKAEALAGAAGVRLAALQRIEEGGVHPVEPFRYAAALEAGTPVQPGRVRVSAAVTLTYRVEPRSGPEERGGRGRRDGDERDGR